MTFYSFALIFFGTNDTTITIATPEIQRLQSATTNYLYCFSIYLFEPLSDGLKILNAHHRRVTLPRTHTITMDTNRVKRTACTCILFSFTYVVCLLIPARKLSVPWSQGVRSQFCWASSFFITAHINTTCGVHSAWSLSVTSPRTHTITMDTKS